MLKVKSTKKVLERIYDVTARTLADSAYLKFKGNAAGNFNVYTIGNNGNKHSVLVYFQEEDFAIVMTYEEALNMPVLGDKCREIWTPK